MELLNDRVTNQSIVISLEAGSDVKFTVDDITGLLNERGIEPNPANMEKLCTVPFFYSLAENLHEKGLELIKEQIAEVFQ